MTGLVKLDGEENDGWAIESQFTTSGNIGWETITIDFDATASNSHPKMMSHLPLLEIMHNWLFSPTLVIQVSQLF